MKLISRSVFILCLGLAIFTSFTIAAENDAWLIVPGVKAGPITANTSEADLIKIYGKENVKREEATDGEGMESEMGSVIYPNDSEKMIKVLWKDTKQMKFPKALELSGDKSVWKTAEGISLGTSVKELEKLNGGRFSFWGFGWDAGGGIKSWDNGKFEKKYSPLLLMIRLSDKNISMVEHKELIGDRVISSSNELVQKLNPKVSQISINFK